MIRLRLLAAILAATALEAAASAQITLIPAFTGQSSESFETQPALQLDPCAVGRVFQNQADLCTPLCACTTISPDWSGQCTVFPHTGNRLAVAQAGPPSTTRFEQVQPDLFSAPGAQPNAWADYDNDGDLDLFVGFQQGKPNRLYRNDRGTFTDVAADLGIADVTDTRAAAWGDFDADGDIDLYVGFTRRSETPK